MDQSDKQREAEENLARLRRRVADAIHGTIEGSPISDEFVETGRADTESPHSQGPDYVGTFGESVPPHIGRWVSIKGLEDQMNQMLQAQIDKGEPVKDWDSFAEPLYAPFRVPASEQE